MQRRAFGIEIEYSVACRRKDDRHFKTDHLANNFYVPLALLLKEVFPFDAGTPERLKTLCFFPEDKIGSYWLGANGARFYFDMQGICLLPEYATPECMDPKEALCHSVAGDTIVEDLRQELLRQGLLAGAHGGAYDDIFVFRINTHFRDDLDESFEVNAVGCHENYTTLEEFAPDERRMKKFYRFRDAMVPFLVTRQIFDGAGGIRRDAERGWQYVISQRAFFISRRASPDTTSTKFRGLINFRLLTRESPPGCVRLHLHCGDATMSPWGKYIAMSATHLVLRALEEGGLDQWKYKGHRLFFKEDLRALSADPLLTAKIRVLCGEATKKFRATDLQKEYVGLVERVLKKYSDKEKQMLRDWEAAIELLAKNPDDAADMLDWAIKQNFLRECFGINLESEKARFASVLYHDISPRGIYHSLVRRGAVKPFVEPSVFEACRQEAPKTRAEFRSRWIKAILRRPDNSTRFLTDWERFPGIGDPVLIFDPLCRSTQDGEKLINQFEKMLSGQRG